MTREERKNKIISAIITSIIMGLMFLLFAFLGLSYQIPPPEARKVLMVELTMESGGGGGGGGNMESYSVGIPQGAAENIVTQPDIELPAIPTSSVKTTEQTTSVVSSQVVQEQPKTNPNALFRPGMGGGSGTGTGTGTGSGFGAGSGSGSGGGSGSGHGGGIGYGTANRGHIYMPELTVDEVGKVYVEVLVEADGSVADARILNNSQYPTTITNSNILNNCIRKAKTAKYRPGKTEFRVIIFQ